MDGNKKNTSYLKNLFFNIPSCSTILFGIIFFRLQWDLLVQPAIDLAENGFLVSEELGLF